MRINDFKLSKHFKGYELECNDGNNQLLVGHSKLLTCMDALRELVEKPMIPNSGYRTKAYNKKIGGSPTSQHLLGKAVDFPTPKGMTVKQFADIGRKAGFTGIGLYDWGCHFDVRDKPLTFDLRK